MPDTKATTTLANSHHAVVCSLWLHPCTAMQLHHKCFSPYILQIYENVSGPTLTGGQERSRATVDYLPVCQCKVLWVACVLKDFKVYKQ
eukprot:3691594-Amphidinium_carterae.1